MAEVNIYVEPKKIWDFFKQNRSECVDHMIPVAENTESQTIIYMTDIQGFLYFFVYEDDEQVHAEGTMTSYDAEDTASFLYETYILKSDEKESSEDDEFEFNEDEIAELIAERESEIDDAFLSFAKILLDCNDFEYLVNCDTDEYNSIKDFVIDALADSGLMIYRPTVIEGAGGEPELCDYPCRDNWHGSPLYM